MGDDDKGAKPPAPGWWEDENGGWHPPAGEVEAEDKKPGGCGGVLLLLLAVAVVLAIVSGLSGDGGGSDGADDAPSADELDAGAFDVCTQFVKDRLKSPSTAKFRNFYEDDGEVVVTHAADTYTVSSTVDSENGFGAMLRSTFRCEVRHVSGTSWRLVDLQIV